MDQAKLLEMQLQMRQNNADLDSFIKGLDGWENEMKKKEEELKKEPDNDKDEALPPVRNSLQRKKKKKKQKPKETTDEKPKPKRISGYDFRAWDKFDVDKAIEGIEEDEDRKSGSSSEYETDEEWEIERRAQQAKVLKDEGNLYFKQKKYDHAIECYTKAIDCDPENAVLPANRAMALLKQNKYGAADIDCTTSISLDPTYVKAYSRRASARLGLGRLEDADRDFDKVLVLEPGNKYARAEKEKIQKKLKPQTEETTESTKEEQPEINSETGIIHAIYKPPSQRSKKPLRRIKIEEVGVDDGASIRQAIAKTESMQSEAKKKVTEQDSSMFERFVTDKPQKIPAENSPAHTDTSERKSMITETNSEEIRGEESTQMDHKKQDVSTGEEKGSTSSTKRTQTKKDAESSKPNAQTTSPRIPDVPKTSFQFQADWKSIKKSPEVVFHYLKAIDPSNYVTLFGQALDADILNLIFSTLSDFYLPAKHDVYPVLENLTRVKRFSMTAMFMSPKEKNVVRGLISALRESKEHSEDEISNLAKAYDL